MDILITRTAKLQPRVKRTKAIPSYANSYFFEPDGSDDQQLGSLFVVVESLTGLKQGEAVSDLIIETVGEHYFNQGPLEKGQTVLGRFESAIKATNQALAAHADHGNASWVGRLSAIIAIVSGSEVHITQAGSAEGYLYRAQISSHITEDLQSKGPHRPAATFSNIASGQVQVHDKLLLSTPALLHQVNQLDLSGIIRDSTPNGAISKISGLLADTDDADRVAAIVTEITRADLLALQTRPDEPAEIKVGKPDKPLEVAKAVAGPAVDSLVARSRDVGSQAIKRTRSHVLPFLRRAALAGAAKIRQQLSTKRGRQVAAGLVILIVAYLGVSTLINSQAHAFDNDLKRYDQDFSNFGKAQGLRATAPTTARDQLVSVQKDLTDLSKIKNRSAFDQKLAHRSHPEDDPASIDVLLASVNTQIDLVDGIETVAATNIADLSQLKGIKPSLISLLGSKVVLVDGQNGSVAVYDLTKRSLATAVTNPSGVGAVTAVTANTNGDGIYLLTSEPAVWLFSLADNSMTKQGLTSGDWPAGRSIASYGGNIYIQAPDGGQIYKHTPTSAGFSSKSAYFAADIASANTGSTTMTVDGAIYLGLRNGISRFVQGKPNGSATGVPSSYTQSSQIQSVSDGNLLVALDNSTHRVGLFNAESAITYVKQLKIKDQTPSAISSDSKGQNAYAISGSQLISFTLTH